MVVRHGDSRQTLPLHTKRRYHACARLSSPAATSAYATSASLQSTVLVRGRWRGRLVQTTEESFFQRSGFDAQGRRASNSNACSRRSRSPSTAAASTNSASTRACASGSSARSAAVAVPSVRKLSGTSGSGRRQRAASAIHRADERRDEGQGVGAVGTLRGAIDVTILQWPTSSAIHDGPGDMQWLAARLRSRAPASQSPAAKRALRSRAGADEP